MKFIGGVLDGEEYEVDLPILRVSVKDGKRYSYPDQVVREHQVYVRVGDEYRYKKTLTET